MAHLYQKARKAKKNTVHAKQEEILSWYYYAKGFEKRVDDILSICRNNKRADDLARIQVYDDIWDCLSGVSRENFRKQTQRAYKIYKLFDGIGIEKIKRVKSYSANGISKLTNPQIQHIITILVRCQLVFSFISIFWEICFFNFFKNYEIM